MSNQNTLHLNAFLGGKAEAVSDSPLGLFLGLKLQPEHLGEFPLLQQQQLHSGLDCSVQTHMEVVQPDHRGLGGERKNGR